MEGDVIASVKSSCLRQRMGCRQTNVAKRTRTHTQHEPDKELPWRSSVDVLRTAQPIRWGRRATA
jgi:hypothetical protein